MIRRAIRGQCSSIIGRDRGIDVVKSVLAMYSNVDPPC